MRFVLSRISDPSVNRFRKLRICLFADPRTRYVCLLRGGNDDLSNVRHFDQKRSRHQNRKNLTVGTSRLESQRCGRNALKAQDLCLGQKLRRDLVVARADVYRHADVWLVNVFPSPEVQ